MLTFALHNLPINCFLRPSMCKLSLGGEVNPEYLRYTHFDEAILITMAKSIADNAQRFFFVEISDPFLYYTDSNASVIVGPIFIDTLALL